MEGPSFMEGKRAGREGLKRRSWGKSLTGISTMPLSATRKSNGSSRKVTVFFSVFSLEKWSLWLQG